MVKHPKKGSAAKSILTIILLLCAAIGLFLLLNRGKSAEVTDNHKVANSNSPNNTNKPRGDDATDSKNNKPIPPTLQLQVPFTPQAPTANWDELHNEACEEASIIMAYAYFNNITSLPPVTVEKEITKLTDWQKDNYGYYLSITTPEAAQMAEEVYKLKTEIVKINENTIKQALANGKLVILPAQGQMLDNPNFTPPGPIYHMLVITGYDSTGFITNDPGTRNGRNYKYTYDTLEAAAGNWSHTQYEVNTSDKRIILVSK